MFRWAAADEGEKSMLLAAFSLPSCSDRENRRFKLSPSRLSLRSLSGSRSRGSGSIASTSWRDGFEDTGSSEEGSRDRSMGAEPTTPHALSLALRVVSPLLPLALGGCGGLAATAPPPPRLRPSSLPCLFCPPSAALASPPPTHTPTLSRNRPPTAHKKKTARKPPSKK